MDKSDSNLVQRVMAYGGTLPGWQWTCGAGRWHEFYQDAFRNPDGDAHPQLRQVPIPSVFLC